MKRLALTVIAGAALAWAGWALVVRAHHLSFVPEAMNVSWISYVAEESWGFGPGGNETGIIVYPMPDALKDGLSDGGIAWLAAMPPNKRSGWQGRYFDWHETPFAAPDDPDGLNIWDGEARAESCGHGAGIARYMFRYGFCIPFDHGIEGMVNRALAAPGSYYAFGRIGMIVLIPAEKRIVYAYNG
jgi:hypothetical protein